MILLAINVLVGAAIQIYQNYVSKELFKNRSDQYVFMLIVYIFSALSTLAANGFTVGAASAFAIIDGAIYGILLPTTAFCLLQAYACGPMSLTSLCLTASIMIPIIPSWVLWKDPISVTQIVGMAIVFAAIVLILNIGKTVSEEKVNKKWAILCLIAFFASGLEALTEKVLKVSPYAEQETAFLLSCFVTAGILTTIILLYSYFVKKEKKTYRLTPKVALPMVGLGIFTTVGGLLVLACLARFPASVYFTINNGARLIVITIVDIIFFKQKITPNQYAGLVLGIIGITLLGM